MRIPESELKFSFSRSGGAGGQNVNKVETKVTIRWNFQESKALSESQKALIAEKLKNRIDKKSGELVVCSQTERTQGANRSKAIEMMNALVGRAAIASPERKSTKVPKREKIKRKEEKRKISEKKELRRRVDY
jgi:ribosome-associated protein